MTVVYTFMQSPINQDVIVSYVKHVRLYKTMGYAAPFVCQIHKTVTIVGTPLPTRNKMYKNNHG